MSENPPIAESDEPQGSNCRRTSVQIGNLPINTDPSVIRDIFVSFNVQVLYVEITADYSFAHCNWTEELDSIIKSMKGCSLQCGTILTFFLTDGDDEVKRREQIRRKIQEPSTILFVFGIDTSIVAEIDIFRVFNEVAPVQKVMIRKKFCFIRFKDVRSASSVMREFHGKEVFGKKLSIEFGMAGGAAKLLPPVASSQTILRIEDNSAGKEILDGQKHEAGKICKREILRNDRPERRKRSRSRSRDNHLSKLPRCNRRNHDFEMRHRRDELPHDRNTQVHIKKEIILTRRGKPSYIREEVVSRRNGESCREGKRSCFNLNDPIDTVTNSSSGKRLRILSGHIIKLLLLE